MTVVLDLPPEMERKMQEVAQAEDLDVPALVRDKMAARLPFPVAPASMTDRQLLEEINQGFPEAFWDRFRQLVAKRRAETMTPEEQQEAIRMTDQTEARAVDRLQYLVELSARSGKSVQQLMAEMGIRPVRLD